MSFVFGLCALLGILLLIFSEVGLAQPGGFRPGGAAIGNPLNDPGAIEDDFEEFDDGLDAPQPAPRAKNGKFGGRDEGVTGGIRSVALRTTSPALSSNEIKKDSSSPDPEPKKAFVRRTRSPPSMSITRVAPEKAPTRR